MKKDPNGFSLVEVVIALGIATFVLLTMVALLPAGIKSNKVSVQETTAAGILTMLEADLRNTHPLLNGGKSQIFGLTLPYVSDTSGKYSINSALLTDTLTPAAGQTYTTGVAENGMPVAANANPPPFYQASIIFTRLPPTLPAPSLSLSLAPVEAHLIVNWPYLTTTTISDLTNPAKVSGFLDAYVAFPSP